MSNWISYVDKGKKKWKDPVHIGYYLIFKDMTLKQV